MPDSPNDGERAPHKPLPQCKAFLVCMEVEFDDLAGQVNLYGIVSSLGFSKFPAGVPPLALFLQLYDGIGRYRLTAELRDLAGGVGVEAEAFTDVEFPERLVTVKWIWRCRSTLFGCPVLGGTKLPSCWTGANWQRSLLRRRLQMTMRRDNDESSDAAKRPEQASESSPEVRRRGRVLTAKDAGWIGPTVFVAPLTFVPVDPPRPIKKAPPVG